MRIFVITFGDENAASTSYRIVQYRRLFEQRGHSITLVTKKQLSLRHLRQIAASDLVINQKSILPAYWGRLFRLMKKPIVFDWDDAFWTSPAPRNAWTQRRVLSRLHWWLRNSRAVLCANRYIEDYSKQYSRRTQVIYMGLDLSQWQRQRPRGNSFDIGWVGAPANVAYLKLCEKELGAFLQQHPDSKFTILCGKRPELSIPFEFTPWAPGLEKKFLEQIDVGILPLPEMDDFTKGKSPIKSLQYMAYGIPVVGNMTVGGSAEIAEHGGCRVVREPSDWGRHLESLRVKETYAKSSVEALNNVREHHDLRKLFDQFLAALEACVKA